MKKHLHIIAFIVMCASPVMAAPLNDSATLIDQKPATNIPPAEPQFAKVIDDLPLMDGLELLPDNDVLFVAPRAGRIAETEAQGMVDVDAVYNFYRRSLPQMGWKIIDARTYTRDGEMLHIDAHADGKLTSVMFSVKPVGDTK